jgi:mannitol/fructose-specific phosphotransferase system IIA component (Ntr-type)
MLQQIMLTIQDETLSQKLLDAGTADELLALLDGTQQGEQ